MPRVLTAARVTVAPEHAGEYLELIHQLAVIGEDRGQHLWVFRSMASPGMFLEFSESRTELTHRSRARPHQGAQTSTDSTSRSAGS